MFLCLTIPNLKSVAWKIKVVNFQEMVPVRQGGALIEMAAILFSDIKPTKIDKSYLVAP